MRKGLFVFSEFFPSNQVNSANMRKALQKFLKTTGTEPPGECKFFRGQMANMISRGLKDMDITPVPSRRCFGLLSLLEQRYGVYKMHPKFDPKARISSFSSDFSSLAPLPGNLKGERWEFVNLPAKELQKEAREVEKGNIVGDVLDLFEFSDNIKPDTLIPGVAVFSYRSDSLAVWTDGMEMAAMSNSPERACIVLETGISDRWSYAPYQQNEGNAMVAQAWEQAKQQADGLHFLAIMKDEDADESDGLWIMQDKPLPKV